MTAPAAAHVIAPPAKTPDGSKLGKSSAYWRSLVLTLAISFVLVSGQNNLFRHASAAMGNFYDELEIEDFSWDPVARVFHYPCPCGDRFEISKSQLRNGEEIATCPSCSLIVRVIYDYVSPL